MWQSWGEYLCLCHLPGMGSGIILCMHPANERRRYDVTSSLIGWVHTQNDPCGLEVKLDWFQEKHKWNLVVLTSALRFREQRYGRVSYRKEAEFEKSWWLFLNMKSSPLIAATLVFYHELIFFLERNLVEYGDSCHLFFSTKHPMIYSSVCIWQDSKKIAIMHVL